MGMAGLIALVGMVTATIAFALSDNLNAVASIWIVAIGILLFGGVRFGQSHRNVRDLRRDWDRP